MALLEVEPVGQHRGKDRSQVLLGGREMLFDKEVEAMAARRDENVFLPLLDETLVLLLDEGRPHRRFLDPFEAEVQEALFERFEGGTGKGSLKRRGQRHIDLAFHHEPLGREEVVANDLAVLGAGNVATPAIDALALDDLGVPVAERDAFGRASPDALIATSAVVEPAYESGGSHRYLSRRGAISSS